MEGAPTHEPASTACPVCGGAARAGGYAVRGVPVQTASVYLGPDRAPAARGDIDLAACDACGLVFNRSFDPATQDFFEDYEEAQDFSPTFKGYALDLATRLAERHGLRGKRIVEIGCGKGGFLGLLCRVAGATGVGIDPACDPDRLPADLRDRLTVVKAEYGDEHREIIAGADFVCCRHTLEHIFDPAALVGRLREHLADRTSVPFVADVPSGAHVLDVGGFWDVYYEHCMYYTDEAFAGMLRRCGFEVAEAWREYGGQYLLVETRPGARSDDAAPAGTLERLERAGRLLNAKREAWGRWLAGLPPEARVALWGSGSRAVGCLGSVPGSQRVGAVVDVSPYRAGRFMPLFERAILSPQGLAEEGCDFVVVMNPMYREEITGSVRELGMDAEVLTVDEPPS